MRYERWQHRWHTTGILFSRRVTHSSTLGENAYLVENTSTLWCSRKLLAENVHFGWILLMGMYWRVFLIGYRHISVRFCVCEISHYASYLLLQLTCKLITTTATLGTLQTNYLITSNESRWVSVKVPGLILLFVFSFRIFRQLSNELPFQWVFFTEMLPWPHMLKQDLAGFIGGNQVIRLQGADGGRCNN